MDARNLIQKLHAARQHQTDAADKLKYARSLAEVAQKELESAQVAIQALIEEVAVSAQTEVVASGGGFFAEIGKKKAK